MDNREKRRRHALRQKYIKKQKRIRIFKRIRFLLIIGVLVGLVILFKYLTRDYFETKNLRSQYQTKYDADKNYMQSLKSANSNYFFDNIIYSENDNKFTRSDSFKLSDKRQISLSKKLYMDLSNYMNEAKINEEDISVSILNLEKDEGFSFNANKERPYTSIDTLILNMMYSKLKNENTFDLEDKVILHESELVAGSSFFDESNIGMEYILEEVIKLAIRNNDATSANLLKSYMAKTFNKSYQDLVSDILNINSNQIKTVEDGLKIAQNFYNDRNTYNTQLNRLSKTREDAYINFISAKDIISYNNISDENIFDFGYIEEANNAYIYSIFTEGLDNKTVSILAETLDRSMREYYIQKKY